jgi:hypothetical protein
MSRRSTDTTRFLSQALKRAGVVVVVVVVVDELARPHHTSAAIIDAPTSHCGCAV